VLIGGRAAPSPTGYGALVDDHPIPVLIFSDYI